MHCYRENGSVPALGESMWLVLSKFHDQPFLTPGPSIVQLAAPLTLFFSAILFCYLLPTCNIALFAVASASCCYVDGQFFLPCSGCGE